MKFRSIVILVLVVVLLGSLGTAGFLYYQQRVEQRNLNRLEQATVQLENGDTQTAIQLLLPLVQQGKRFQEADEALYQLARAYQQGGHAEALELWQRLAENYPQSPYVNEALLQQARLVAEDDPEKAQAIYREIQDAGDPLIQGQALLGMAQQYEDRGNIDQAREVYYQILETDTSAEIISQAKDRLSEINTQLLWSPTLDEFSQLYTVKPGDVPIEIGAQFGVPSYYVLEANNIQGALRPGKRLKVPKEPFKVTVDKEACRLELLTESGRFIKWYPVGVGQQSYKTPAGVYTIENKQIDPTWYRPTGGVIPPGDPENALGTRWMGIGSSLGIHGTNEPDTIGYRESAGCIRMYNEDAEELFKLLTLGSKVIIEEESNEEPTTPS